jgi:hypothetical protein
VVALGGVDFAEFDPRNQHEGQNILISEDYALEIVALGSDCDSSPAP